MAQIVVGIDGSVESRRALAWALDEARRRDSEVLVVHAYQRPREERTLTALPYMREPVARDVLAQDQRWRAERHERSRQHAVALVDGMVRDVAPDGAGVVWRPVVLDEDRPARALLEAARGADLLVVGSRGLGAVAGVVLGSVSQHCTRRATCPVVVVNKHGSARTTQRSAA